jgi:hypothetical protein
MNAIWAQAFDALLTVSKTKIRISFPISSVLLKHKEAATAPRVFIEPGKIVFEWLSSKPSITRGNSRHL